MPQSPPASHVRSTALRLLGAILIALAPIVAAQQPAASLAAARDQHTALAASPRTASLTVAWQSLGPIAITSPAYGALTGRITALATDPGDPTGSTLYIGTTGGGVFKSTNALAATPVFTPLTDTQVSLAIGAIAVQPATNPVVLAGTGDPNSALDSLYGLGLLRSTNGGLTWTSIQASHDGTTGNHSLLGLATAAIAFSTATPSLVVAAMATSAQGAADNASNSGSVPGLYVSNDSGVTWQMATVYDGTNVVQQPLTPGSVNYGNAATAVVWNPLRRIFIAALRGHGYYTSSDGATWQRLTAQPGTTLTAANCPAVTSANCPLYRGALTVNALTGDTYALTVDSANNDLGLWQDLCAATSGNCATPAPTFATRIDNGALDTGGAISQGTYNLALAAAPTATGTTLYVGTVDAYRCTIASGTSACALRNTTNTLNGCANPAGVAASLHAFAVPATTSATFTFLGTDGGLWLSADGIAETGSVCAATDAAHFTNLNTALGTGGSLAEFTAFAQHPTDPNTLLAGLGANGSATTTAASSLTAWPQMSAGEGGYPALDPVTPTNWFLTIGAALNLKACSRGANCTAADFAPPATLTPATIANDITLLDAPLLLDPAQPTNVLVGSCRIGRGPAASSAAWSTANFLSPSFSGSAVPCTTNAPRIRSIAAGGPIVTNAAAQNSGSTVIYAGLAGFASSTSLPGHLFVTTHADTANSATAWTDAALSPVTNDVSNAHVFNPAGFDVTGVAVDPHDPTGATVYAAIAGFAYPVLYRSTDFGAHWLNISSNLPGAPANAVLVDPNDANTVYVALDTGVYVTAAVTTCATASCWSVMGTALPNSPVTALAAAAAMPTGDGRLGMLRAATYGRGLWQQPLLTAASPVRPALTAAPTSLTFAAQAVSTASTPQIVTLASSGNGPAAISSVTISGDYAETDTCAGQTLNLSATCTVTVIFTPTATGSRTGTLTVYANIAGGQLTVPLTGTGLAPAAVALTPASLTFAATVVNQTTAAQNIVVANTGGSSATLATPSISGDFALTANTCSATLPASTSCTVSITFTPTASGARSGAFTVATSSGTLTAQLTGTGLAPATDTLSATSLTFPQQQITTASTPQQITVTNAGDQPLNGLSATVSGTDFSFTNNCGSALPGHSTCAFLVTFVPTATGTRTATLTITDAVRFQTVALTGIGVAPPGISLTPAAVAFPVTPVGLTSQPQILTLTNNGGAPLSITSATVSSGFTITASTCGSTLAVSASCALSIVFTPAQAGTFTGTLTLIDNAPGGVQLTQLTATGLDFALNPTGPTSQTTTGIASASFPLVLNSVAGLSGTVAFSCSGAPAHATCAVSPSTAPLGTSTAVTVTVLTGSARLANPFAQPPVFFAGLGFVLLFLRRRPWTSLPFLALLFTLSGCGAGREIPASSVASTPTPTGTYTLTVSATSATITHTQTLTLIVQ